MNLKNDVFGVFSVFSFGVKPFFDTRWIHQNTSWIHLRGIRCIFNLRNTGNKTSNTSNTPILKSILDFSQTEKCAILKKVWSAEIKFLRIASIACVSTLRHFSEKLYLLIQLRASIACVCTLSFFWKKSFTCKIAFWEIPRPFVLCWKKNKLTLLSKEKW